MAPEEEATKRAMRIDGRELNTEYLARPKHNPGIKKKRQKFFKKSQLRRKYRVLKRKEGFEDDEERTIREKKRKLAPFEKEVEKGKKVNEEREALESKIKREKQVAKERRSAKRAGLKARTRTGQPVMRHRMRAIIDKLEKT